MFSEHILGLALAQQQQHPATFDSAGVLHQQHAGGQHFGNNAYFPMAQPASQALPAPQVFTTLPTYTPMPLLSGSPVYGSPTAFPGSPAPVLQQQTHFVPAMERRSVFFAGVTPVVTSDTLLALFRQFGRVLDLNLFKPWAGSKTSKGCGLVVFEDNMQAAAALQTLNGRFQWPGARGPMVVEWMDTNKQHKKARAQPLMQPLAQHPFMVMQSRVTAGMVPAQLCMLNTPQPVPIMF